MTPPRPARVLFAGLHLDWRTVMQAEKLAAGLADPAPLRRLILDELRAPPAAPASLTKMLPALGALSDAEIAALEASLGTPRSAAHETALVGALEACANERQIAGQA